MSTNDSAVALAIEGTRADLLAHVNKALDALKAKLTKSAALPAGYKIPTVEQCRDASNKIGDNLTDRGVEMLYRLFDDNAGYNRAAKSMDITPTAARNRKRQWEKKGGLDRERMSLDIDG